MGQPIDHPWREASVIARIWLAVALASTTVLSLPTPVSASCQPRSPQPIDWMFAGTGLATTPLPDGVRADILEYDPYAHEFVSAWAMLHKGTTRWAQIGWMKAGGYTSRSVFTQYTLNDTHGISNFWTEMPVGTYTTYKVVYEPSTDFIYMHRDSFVMKSVLIPWVPTAAAVRGEIHNGADQMPGGTGNHEVFRNAWMSYTGSLPWVSMNSPATATNSGWHGATKVGSDRYEIWDRACAS